MKNNNLTKIFERGSKTFFNSARLFPKDVRDEVTVLYAFVRTADDLVDKDKPKREEFKKFQKDYDKVRNGIISGNSVIDNFVELAKRKGFEDKWTEAFLAAMERDLDKKTYETMEETVEYMYGSANVIGLFMNRIMGVSKEADKYAELLGQSLQYINFVRDIEEDNRRGRRYLPTAELKKYGLNNLSRKEAELKEEEFGAFIRAQIEQYGKWQKEAEKGFRYIPKKYLGAVKTASDLYRRTAEKIYREPMAVFEKKIRPNNLEILVTGLRNLISVK